MSPSLLVLMARLTLVERPNQRLHKLRVSAARLPVRKVVLWTTTNESLADL